MSWDNLVRHHVLQVSIRVGIKYKTMKNYLEKFPRNSKSYLRSTSNHLNRNVTPTFSEYYSTIFRFSERTFTIFNAED